MSQQQNRFRALSTELIALIIFIILALFFASKVSRQPQKIVSQNTSPAVFSTPPEPTTTVFPKVTPETTTPTKTNSPESKSQTPSPAGPVVTLNFQSSEKNYSYKITIDKKTTVIEVMLLAEKQGLILQKKDYGKPLGILIEGVNGILNDSKNQKYWTLYVNNARSAVGASSVEVSPADTITWKYENTTL